MKRTLTGRMKKTYTERLKDYVGPAQEGREDYFDLTPQQSIKMIKEQIKTNYSCTLWTMELPDKELQKIDNSLTKEGITHCFDEVVDGFICFKNEKDMRDYYDHLRKETDEKILNYIRKHKYNTPIINWYE